MSWQVIITEDRAVVERSLPKPDVRGSKIVIGMLYCQLHRKEENKEEEAENGPFKNRNISVLKTLKHQL